jgi:bleomycin hydrolase
MAGIKSEEYYSFTSFSHHPFHQYFILEIPDNYMNGSYFNVNLDEMVSIIDYALEHGYTVLWDGDVGEKGFSQKEGVAVLPVNPDSDSIFTKPGKRPERRGLLYYQEFMGRKRRV